MKDDLERYYEKKFPNKTNKKAEFADFIIILLMKIDNYYSQAKKPLNILTTSYNVIDGIGDYVNQIDFTDWLYNIFDQYENIRVQSISILEKEKFTLANKLMPDNLKKMEL